MERLFQIVNLLPMPLWLGMMFAPRHPLTERASRSSAVFALAALNYVASLGLTLVAGRKEGDQPALPDFTSLSGIQEGLGTKEGALAAWSHMVALDLFTGAWIYRESRRLEAPWWVRIPSLIFTLMAGPFGLLLFLAWRVLGAGQSAAIPTQD